MVARICLQLRQAELPLGDTRRNFHTRALMLGSVGLDTLRRALSDEVMADDEEDDEDDFVDPGPDPDAGDFDAGSSSSSSSSDYSSYSSSDYSGGGDSGGGDSGGSSD